MGVEMRLVMVIYYIKFPAGAWGIYFAKVRNFYLQKTEWEEDYYLCRSEQL
jgi:hypothetical protein